MFIWGIMLCILLSGNSFHDQNSFLATVKEVQTDYERALNWPYQTLQFLWLCKLFLPLIVMYLCIIFVFVIQSQVWVEIKKYTNNNNNICSLLLSLFLRYIICLLQVTHSHTVESEGILFDVCAGLPSLGVDSSTLPSMVHFTPSRSTAPKGPSGFYQFQIKYGEKKARWIHK